MKRTAGITAALVATVLLAFGGTTDAASLANGSFENGSFGGGGFQTLTAGTGSASAINGWLVTSGDVDWIANYWNAEDGSMSLDMNGLGAGAISESFDTLSGREYHVTFWLAGNPACNGFGASEKTLRAAASGTAASDYSVDSAGTSIPSIRWSAQQYSFIAAATSTTLSFASQSAENFCGPALDNVSIDLVPQPVAASGADCKKDGWKTMHDADGKAFKNQGDCVSWFATHGDTPIGSKNKKP